MASGADLSLEMGPEISPWVGPHGLAQAGSRSVGSRFDSLLRLLSFMHLMVATSFPGYRNGRHLERTHVGCFEEACRTSNHYDHVLCSLRLDVLESFVYDQWWGLTKTDHFPVWTRLGLR